MATQHCQMIQAGDLQAIVGDASRDSVGGPQYCGLWSLTSKHRVFNAFGNTYAGLLPGEIRGKSPVLEVVDERTVALVRKTNALHASDCRTTYQLNGRHYVDHALTLRDHADLRVTQTTTPFREVSWCCYMNSPEDRRVRFLSKGKWHAYIPPKHGIGSNVAPSYVPDAELEVFPTRTERNGYMEPFHYDRIAQRFDEPFYYGRVGDMVMILIFDTPRWLRFFLSPSGGGGSMLPGLSCPAWDFEWLIPAKDYRVGQEYTFRMRLVYKPFVSDADVLEEYRRAVGDLGFEKVS
ncbi:MAG: hypothetical protein NTW19_13185 [Planctomycetota bacterium]|nr:hypothetical protein [Planctomycetota bacterium]